MVIVYSFFSIFNKSGPEPAHSWVPRDNSRFYIYYILIKQYHTINSQIHIYIYIRIVSRTLERMVQWNSTNKSQSWLLLTRVLLLKRVERFKFYSDCSFLWFHMDFNACIIPQDEGKDKDDYDLYRLMSMSCMMYSNLLKTNWKSHVNIVTICRSMGTIWRI